MEYESDLDWSNSNKKRIRAFTNTMKKRKPKQLDEKFSEAHDEVFEEIDCLNCANCCKTTSPIFQMSDIERLGRLFKQSPAEFIDEHLRLDDENDFVLRQSPCPFLLPDNKCLVYEDRPKACREYPHTNRKRMNQIMDLTFENSLMCPAVSRIMQKLMND